MPADREDVVTLRAAGAMAMLKGWVAVAFALSVTWTPKLAVPGADGVPLMVPAADNDNPAGSEPDETDQV